MKATISEIDGKDWAILSVRDGASIDEIIDDAVSTIRTRRVVGVPMVDGQYYPEDFEILVNDAVVARYVGTRLTRVSLGQ